MTIVVVSIVAVAMGVMGLAALAAPERFLATTGSEIQNRDGRNEVRAVYGGYGLAMAGILVYALSAEAFRPGILLCMALALLGMAGGRVISALVDRGLSRLMAGLTIIETAGGVALLWVSVPA